MQAAREHTYRVNGIELFTVAMGDGPLVLLCHGMPGLWYSWRHQLPALADAGYTTVAFDQRGYGRSSRPTEVEAYDSHHTVADVLGLIRAFGRDDAILIGQDFGAAQVYNAAVRFPQHVRAVVGMACPYDFDFSGRGGAGSQPSPDVVIDRAFARPDRTPEACFAEIAKHQFFYAHYFQAIGPAERELGGNARLFLTRLFWALSGQGSLLDWDQHPADVRGYLDVLADPDYPLPWSWMSEKDMDYYVDGFERGGADTAFIGGLSAYRVATRNWHINAQWADAVIEPPSLFIAGAADPVITMVGEDALRVLEERSRDLRGIHLVPGAGHFVQQEASAATNAAILDFLETLAG